MNPLLFFCSVLINLQRFPFLSPLQLLVAVQLAELQATSIAGDEVIATLGQPVLLKCDLGMQINPSVIRIYWQGRNTSDSVDEFPQVLHAFNKGVEEFDKQTSCYRSRTSINRDLIRQGDLSLLISEAKVKDDGTQLIVHLQEKDVVKNICRKTLRVAGKTTEAWIIIMFLGKLFTFLCNEIIIYEFRATEG